MSTDGADRAPAELGFRTATVDDAPALVALLAAGAVDGPAEPATELGPYREALAEISRTTGNDVLVAEYEGEVVGTCQLIVFRHLQNRGGRCAEIESMHVDPARRSLGIGAALLGEAVRWAREAGCYRVQLTSNKARRQAHRFYRREGFANTHEGFKLVF